MLSIFTAALVLIAYGGDSVDGANILGIFPIGGRSHWLPYEGMMKALLNAGHNITVITSYPQKKPLPNWTDIDISSVEGTKINSLSMDVVSTVLQNPRANFNYITGINRRFCKIAHSFPQTKALIDGSSEHKFDVVFTEIFGADCDVGFAWKLGVPLISVESSKTQPWSYYRLGSPVYPSYMHTIHVDFPTDMNFWQRLYNTAYHLYYVVGYYRDHNDAETNRISRDFFGADVPHINEIISRTSLIFSNSHHTLDGPVPLVPNLIEVAGIHIRDDHQPLPVALQKFMDDAKEGVVYFTLGSLVRVSTLPNSTIDAFRNAFARLPQKVLWKFELEMENMPSNVMISKWFPQKDIFRHPNLKAYISHGGRMGILEAIHYGIPLVGIPLFFDQYRSVASVVEQGIAVSLKFNELTSDNIIQAVNTIINNKEYSIRMKEFSKRFKDRPLTPAQSVVYWTEYVIRHKGAFHLRSPAADMPLYQYLLLDVIAFVTAIAVFVLYLVYKILIVVSFLIQKPFRAAKKLKTP